MRSRPHTSAASSTANGVSTRIQRIQATSQPIWVDHSGTIVGTAGDPGDYQTARLSHDRTRLAVELHDLRIGTGDLWIVDLVRGGGTRFTSDGMHDTQPVWSPDDSEIVFTGRPYGVRNLHLKRVGGPDPDEPLLAPGPDRLPTDWSHDGRHILYTERSDQSRQDLWRLEMPERSAVPFLRTPADEHSAHFSPDKKWVSYVSDETGRDEVYVRSFPDGGGLERISVNGGQGPRWSAGGSEIFFVQANEAVVAVRVTVKAGRLEAGESQVLFRKKKQLEGAPRTRPQTLSVNGPGCRHATIGRP
jgi:Tol biopolymer transport system component